MPDRQDFRIHRERTQRAEKKDSILCVQRPTAGLPAKGRPTVGGVARSETGHNKVLCVLLRSGSFFGQTLIVRGRGCVIGLRATITDGNPSVLRNDLLRYELSGRSQLATVEFEALKFDVRPKNLTELGL